MTNSTARSDSDLQGGGDDKDGLDLLTDDLGSAYIDDWQLLNSDPATVLVTMKDGRRFTLTAIEQP